MKEITVLLKKVTVRCAVAFLNFITLFTKIENDLILFECFFGRSISDNPLAIYESIDKTRYRCVILVNNPSDFPNYPTVKRKTVKAFFYMRKAKIIINNSRMPRYWLKRKEQFYLQTWHGTPLKKLVHDLDLFDMPSASNKEKYLRMFDRETKKWDYLISSCEHATNCFKSAFNFKNKILEIGYPRNKKLYEVNHDIDKIKEKLNIPLDKNILFYAPTYRDNQNTGVGKYFFNDKLDYQLLTEQLKDTIVLVRYHYAITTRNSLNYNNVIDVSNYQDISDLYLVSDILITDYSSVFFDYSILKKPFLFFTPDIEEYKNELRGFYLDMNSDFPTKPTNNTNELIEQIKQIGTYDFESFSDKYNPQKNKECLPTVIKLIDELVTK